GARGRGRRPPRRGGHRARRHRPSPCGSGQGDRARILRRVHARRDRRHARHPGGNGEGPHASRTEETARSARAWSGWMTTGPGHEQWADTAGAYVLGALPDDERSGFEAHVTTCELCRSEIDDLAGAADALPVSAPAMVPPPELKARIMAEVNREAALLAAA